jgi:O-antigen/teichoic acid export membrane protein
MLKRLLNDGVIYGAVGSLSKGVQIFLIPIYTRMFSSEEYGVIDLLIVFAALVNLTVALEISQGVARYYGTAESDKEKSQYASSALLFSVGAYSLLFVVAFALSGWFSSFWLGSMQWQMAFQVAIGAMALNGVYVLLLDLLRWQHRPKFFALTSMLYTSVTVAISLYLVVVQQSGIVGVFYGQLVGAITGIVFILGVSRNVYVFNFYWDKCRTMLTYSFPLVFSSLAVFINLNVDRIAIKELMTVSDVGIYGVGFRIASVMTLLLVGVQAALTPLVFQNYRKDSTPIELARVLRYFLILAFGMTLVLGVLSKEIVALFTVPEYYQSAAIVPIMAATFLFANLYIFSPGLFLAKETRRVAIIGICVACLNICLNTLLISRYGIVGAASATCISAVVGFVAIVYYSQAYYRIPYDWRRLILAAVIVFAALFFSGIVFEERIWESLLFYKLVYLLVFILLLICVLLKRDEFLSVMAGLCPRNLKI